MASILRITEAASLALHTCVYLAGYPDVLIATRQVAKVLAASEAHLSKVLQRLSRAGIVTAIRGPHGGFKLARQAAKISLLDVYQAIEGPFMINVCLNDTPICVKNNCVFGDLLRRVHQQTLDYFSKTTLAKLSNVFGHQGA